MARTIQSPGVQISEVDLSISANLGSPTTVFIPGFAPKGPASDPLIVSSLGEFEQIYGQPTNAAERYFYQTAKAVLQSTANVITYRLPYGDNLGTGTSNQYSALVYPACTIQNGVSSSNLVTSSTLSSATYFFGAPTHVRLTQQQYVDILHGSAFTWGTSGQTAFSTVADLSGAGLIILNKSQSSINNQYEGVYVGVVDNAALNPATSFNNFNAVCTVSNSNTFISGGNYNGYATIPTTRQNFILSASKTGATGSISEIVENIATFDTSTAAFNDTINLGVFKLRQSPFTPDATQLDAVLVEGYNASLDYYRKINSPNGGSQVSYFIENSDNGSPNIITLVNPSISNKNVSTWTGLNGLPSKSVRFLNPARLTDYIGASATSVAGLNTYVSTPSLSSGFATASASFTAGIGTDPYTYLSLCTQYGTTDKIVALGDYAPVDLSTKKIGNVPGKLGTMFNFIENSEIYPLSIVVEAGLGTIYANSNTTTTSGYFDDTIPNVSLSGLYAQDGTGGSAQIVLDYRAVADQFVDFVVNRRKDHLFIADPITNIFVENGLKTVDDPNKNFSDNIYWPLRNQFSFLNNSYTATYANAVQVADSASNRLVWVPFSGFAAGIMANMDSNTHPWNAPAGFTRGIVTGVTDLAFYPKQKQRDQLYKLSINPVVNFPNEGFVVYGQKTMLKQPSAFDRINVRRLFLTLESQTNRVARAFVFEPNTLFTRTQVRNTLTPIFDNAKNTSGVYDYLLVCDERNNPPGVIDDNTLVIDIYIKPVRTAEFILVNFYATRTSQNFAEIVA
jgi:Phage tail sheath protein subtilisin-like domain/Phage tail sheath C-terminal domain